MKICVVGATGVVGREFIEILQKSNIKSSDIELFASKRSLGTQIYYKDKYLTVKNQIKEFGDKNDVAVLCVDKNISKEITPYLLDKGVIVIDCSTLFRKNDDVPLVAVGVNESTIKNNTLISNPNCVVMQVVFPLMMILKKYNISNINIVSFQSVSGSGQKGIDDLRNNTSLFYVDKIKETCIPLVGNILDNGYTEEEDKIRFELRKILDNNELKINSTCVRVPVMKCHGISLSLELNKEVNVQEIISLISKNPNCIYMDVPLGTKAIDNNYVYFGRVRKDLDNPNVVHMYVVGDNLRRGAAYNAFLILEEIMKSRHKKSII